MSTIFENLFEQHPDVNKLKNLPVDKLAGELLLSIKNRDQQNIQYHRRKDENTKTHFRPIAEINLTSLESSIKRRNTDIDNRDDLDDVIYALMEASQFLINHGFLAQIPMTTTKIKTIYSVPTYFLTRKSEAIQTISDWEGISRTTHDCD